ncbi:hypothetical protein KFL_005610030 [Klebsormidium nitens]|uniref:Uncharacterized protein n=1 Tax=Klebsormidium nitens TaxID=105231 RepID=A0A1Y1ILX5_KLENI|nr:hypothetical protein KFL_005610030 [Klebsormidium nitens]|eukprot:GAQ89776.1 hypothetical protein KFL_005610030 [Klebsormidium nitens]
METSLEIPIEHSPRLEFPSRVTPDAFLSTSVTTTASSVTPLPGLVLEWPESWFGKVDVSHSQDSVNSPHAQGGAYDSWQEVSDGDCSESEYWGGELKRGCQGEGKSPEGKKGGSAGNCRRPESGSDHRRSSFEVAYKVGEREFDCREGVYEAGLGLSGARFTSERSREGQFGTGVWPVSGGGRVQSDRPSGVAEMDSKQLGHSPCGANSESPLVGGVLRRGASIPFMSLVSTRAKMHAELQRRPISAVVSDWRIKCHWDMVLDKVSELNKRWAQRRGGHDQGNREAGVIAQWWQGVRRIEAHGGKSIWQELSGGSWENMK